MTDPIKMADVPDNTTITGKTVIYTAGCLNGKSGRKFVNCNIVFPTVEDRVAFCEEIMEFAPNMDVSGLPADMQNYIALKLMVNDYFENSTGENFGIAGCV